MSGLPASALDPMAVERQSLTIEDARSTYGLDSAFDDSLARWWVLVEDRMPDIFRSVSVKQSGAGSMPSDDAVASRVKYAKGKLAADVDQTWIDWMVGVGSAMASADQSKRAVMAGLLSAYSEMHRVLFQVFAYPGELQRLSWAMLQLALVESDIVASEMTVHVEALAHRQLEVRTELFRTELTIAARRMEEATHRISVAVRSTGDWLRNVRALTEARGVHLIHDEVQSGKGRTGKLFPHPWFEDAEPDIMAPAKALGCGSPVGACLATDAAARGTTPSVHGTTFGVNPLAMAVAIAAFDEMAKDTTLASARAAAALPLEAQQNARVWTWLSELVASEGSIHKLVTVGVRESMANGGGPAGLRLRVVADPEAIDPLFIANHKRLEACEAVIRRSWPERIDPSELDKPVLWRRCRSARRNLLSALGFADSEL